MDNSKDPTLISCCFNDSPLTVLLPMIVDGAHVRCICPEDVIAHACQLVNFDLSKVTVQEVTDIQVSHFSFSCKWKLFRLSLYSQLQRRGNPEEKNDPIMIFSFQFQHKLFSIAIVCRYIIFQFYKIFLISICNFITRLLWRSLLIQSQM